MTRPPSPDHAREALGAALAAVPARVHVAWADGFNGTIAGREALSVEGLTAGLRRRLAVPWPKGEGDVLIPARLHRDRNDHKGGAAESVSLLHLDYDRGELSAGEAAERLRALGLEALVFPSPGATSSGPDAGKWRGLVVLNPPVPADEWKALGKLAGGVLAAALGVALDGSVWNNPAGLAAVHPRPPTPGRPPEALLHVRGRALDVGALGARAREAGWYSPERAREAARARVSDPDLMLALVREAGLYVGPEDHRGHVPIRCVGAHYHGTTRRVGTSATTLDVRSGSMLCLSEHSLAPEGLRGRWNTRRMLAELQRQRPDLAPRIFGTLDSAHVAAVREALAGNPPGEGTPRVVAKAGVPDEIAEALGDAVRGGKVVSLTPPPGSGKSRWLGRALETVLRGIPRLTSKASALVGVADRDALPAMAASLTSAGLEPRVHTPVHEILAPDGEPECTHHVEARRLYDRGASARESLCRMAPGTGGRGPCARITDCRARNAWVTWVPTGSDTAAPSCDPPSEDTPWVAVGTFASVPAMKDALGAQAPVVPDETDPALEPVTRTLRGFDLALALVWAGKLAPVRPHKDHGLPNHRRTGAPRVIARTMAEAALTLGPEGMAALAPEAREQWALAVLGKALAGDPRARQKVVEWLDPGMVAASDLVAAALVRWVEEPGTQRVIPTDLHALPQGGGAALEALVRWVGGANARLLPPEDEAGPGVSLGWPSPMAELIRARRAVGALLLDATGDPALALAAVGDPARFEHRPVRVEGGAEVHRVMVVAGHSGRRALAPGYDVRWEEALRLLRAGRDALGATVGSLARPPGAGVVFTTRALAMACWSLSSGRPVEEHPSWLRLSQGQRAALVRSLAAAPPEAREVLASLSLYGAGASPPVEWVWWGATSTRGSNVFAGRGWSITLGDARPSLESTRTSLWARNGVEPDEDTTRAALDRAASAAHEQAHGRLRALQREGEALVMVHVGKVPPLGFYRGEHVNVVTPHTAARWVRPAAVRRVPLGGLALRAPAGEAPDVAGEAHPAVRAAVGAGWGVSELAAATGACVPTVRAWWRGTVEAPGWCLDLVWSVANGSGRGWGRAALARLVANRGPDVVRSELAPRVRSPWEALARWFEGHKGRPQALPPRVEAQLLAALRPVAAVLGVDVGAPPERPGVVATVPEPRVATREPAPTRELAAPEAPPGPGPATARPGVVSWVPNALASTTPLAGQRTLVAGSTVVDVRVWASATCTVSTAAPFGASWWASTLAPHAGGGAERRAAA